jgi:hypothetical protein
MNKKNAHSFEGRHGVGEGCSFLGVCDELSADEGLMRFRKSDLWVDNCCFRQPTSFQTASNTSTSCNPRYKPLKTSFDLNMSL